MLHYITRRGCLASSEGNYFVESGGRNLGIVRIVAESKPGHYILWFSWLSCLFGDDAHRQFRGNTWNEADGDDVITRGLNRLVQLDLMSIELDAE